MFTAVYPLQPILITTESKRDLRKPSDVPTVKTERE